MSEAKFHGHILNQEGVKVDPKKKKSDNGDAYTVDQKNSEEIPGNGELSELD